MVAPMAAALIVSAAVQAGSSIMQYLNSKEGEELTAQERAKLENLVNQIQQPNFDVRDLKPEDYQVIGGFEPRFVKLVKEAAPEMLAPTETARRMQGSQMEVLSQLRELAQKGEDPLTALQKIKAQREVGAAGQAQQQNLDALMQRRGMGLDSGSGLALQQGANAQSLDRMGMMGLQSAADAYQRRNQAMGQQADLSGKIYGQEQSQEEKNVSAINQFNQRMADIQSKQNLANTDIYNQNMVRQQQNQQDVANKNVFARNQAQQFNKDDRNKIAQLGYQNQMDKVRVLSPMSGERVKDITAQTRDTNQRWQSGGDFASGAAYTVGKNWPKESSLDSANKYDQKLVGSDASLWDEEMKKKFGKTS